MLDASDEILDECIAIGGSVTGEHGIGVEKIGFMHKLFTPDDLDCHAPSSATSSTRPAGCSPGKNAPHRRRLRHRTD